MIFVILLLLSTGKSDYAHKALRGCFGYTFQLGCQPASIPYHGSSPRESLERDESEKSHFASWLVP